MQEIFLQIFSAKIDTSSLSVQTKLRLANSLLLKYKNVNEIIYAISYKRMCEVAYFSQIR
jgi:hypothetical protein